MAADKIVDVLNVRVKANLTVEEREEECDVCEAMQELADRAARKAAKEAEERTAKEVAERTAKEVAERTAKEVAERTEREAAQRTAKEVAEKTAREHMTTLCANVRGLMDTMGWTGTEAMEKMKIAEDDRAELLALLQAEN